MLRRFLLLLLMVLAFSPLQTRADDFKPTLFPVDKDGKWGFINATGKIVIPLAFDELMFFSEGLARVKIGEKYGFINERGETVIAPQYELVWPFREGLASVEGNGPHYFIDKTGKNVVNPPSTHRFLEFRDGLAQGRPFSIQRRFPVPETLLQIGWIDRTGKWVIEPKFQNFWDFSEGLAAVSFDPIAPDKTAKMGFIDTTGKLVIPAQFDSATYFRQGLAGVKANGRYFFIDKSGKRAFAQDFDDGLMFSEGLASVKIGEKWGFINRAGKIVIAPTLASGSVFYNGRAAFKVGEKWGFIDQNGQIVVPAIYYSVGGFAGELAFVNFVAEASNGAGRGYINREGKMIWPPRMPIATPEAKQ